MKRRQSRHKALDYGEMKSVPQPDEVGFHREAISPTKGAIILNDVGAKRLMLYRLCRNDVDCFAINDVMFALMCPQAHIIAEGINQRCEALYLINSKGIVYHQSKTLYLIKSQEIHAVA